jgi:predicted peptidase
LRQGKKLSLYETTYFGFIINHSREKKITVRGNTMRKIVMYTKAQNKAMVQVSIVTILSVLLVLFLTTCTSMGQTEPYDQKVEYKLVVEGFEWGPAITKIVLLFNDRVSTGSFNQSTFTVMAGDTVRTVVNAWVSNERGEKSRSGNAITVELKTGYSDAAGAPPFGGPIENSSPFVYDMQTGRNNWVPLSIYTVSLNNGESIIVGGRRINFTVVPDNYAGRISPSTDNLAKSFHTFNGVTLNYASFEPAELGNDSGKNPLVIWLHGAGGGSPTDVDIALYDNDVTAIMEPTIQAYFKKSGLAGAYVLYPQAPTWWMDNGKGEMTAQGANSAFTESLKSLIDFYIAANPDIDTDRIYIGGCSNGGYMTVNMLIHYPGFFAAAYPICEAFLDSELPDATLTSLASEAVWFVHAANDPVVPPETYILPTYARLVAAGAQNLHFSYFENVVGQDAPGIEYLGHFSWIYVLQDRVSLDQDIAAVRSGGISTIRVPSFLPVMVNGRSVSLWDWLAAQRKR